MVVELISVGTEILLGNIVNTNAAFLSEKCAGLGLSCYYQSVVGDNEERLCHTIQTALDRSDRPTNEKKNDKNNGEGYSRQMDSWMFNSKFPWFFDAHNKPCKS